MFWDLIDFAEEMRDNARREYRRWVPWLTRGELREKLVRSWEEHDLAVHALAEEAQKRRYNEGRVGVLDRDLTKTEILLKELLDRLAASADLTARSVADIRERIPDHTPQDEERREVIGRLAGQVH